MRSLSVCMRAGELSTEYSPCNRHRWSPGHEDQEAHHLRRMTSGNKRLCQYGYATHSLGDGGDDEASVSGGPALFKKKFPVFFSCTNFLCLYPLAMGGEPQFLLDPLFRKHNWVILL